MTNRRTGPRRRIVTHYPRRRGDGVYRLLRLECGHIVWRRGTYHGHMSGSGVDTRMCGECKTGEIDVDAMMIATFRGLSQQPVFVEPGPDCDREGLPADS